MNENVKVFKNKKTKKYPLTALLKRLYEWKFLHPIKNYQNSLKSFKKIINTTYSYGSEEAIKILALMQKENYAAAKDNVEQDIYRMIAIYCLAATQIKFDVTGIAVSPNFWFQLRLNDYSEHKEKYRIATNILIKELELNKKFKFWFK